MINMSQAKLLFDSGSLRDPKITRVNNNWIILFSKKTADGWIESVYRNQRKEEEKQFKDLRSAVNTTKEIGFNDVIITNLQN